jgi:hypothetical protein
MAGSRTGARSPARAALLASLLILSGCASTVGQPTAAPAPEPRLSVSVVQNRSDPPVGRLQLRVTNESEDDLRVDTATLESTALARPALWEKGTTIPAGATRDLPVQFPGASCADGDPQTVVRIEGETAAGAVSVEVTPTDPNERMPLLTGIDCFANAVAEVGQVSLASLIVGDPGEPAQLELRVDAAHGASTADSTLRVLSMESTVLFNVLGTDGTPSNSGDVGLELRPGEPSATARVFIVPNRCDPHALAEDKVGTLFVFAAEVEGTEVEGTAAEGTRSGSLSLPASPALRGELYDYFTRACGL